MMWSPGWGATGILFAVLIVAVFLALIALKGYALWHAARRSEKGWFIALLVVNTFGLLELGYLYFVVGKWHAFPSGTKPAQKE